MRTEFQHDGFTHTHRMVTKPCTGRWEPGWQKQKIRVVDDEEDILEMVRFNRDKEGFKVVCSSSGANAPGPNKIPSGSIPAGSEPTDLF